MSFNPKFRPFQPLDGFDDSVKPDWQMVPEGGEKYVYLDDADGMTVEILDAKIAEVSEEPTNDLQTRGSRLFKLVGKSHGQTFLEARHNNVVKASLELAVKAEKKVSLAFGFVTDKIKRTSIKNPSDVPEWIRRLNEIFQPQANISFTHISTRQIKIENNLGSEVDMPDKNLSEWEWDAIASQRDAGADINLFFVWKLAQFTTNGAKFPKGATWKKDCLIADHQIRPADIEIIVIAHEIGHALGIRGDQHFYHPKNRGKFVMYFKSSFAGPALPKVHVNTVNP